MVSSRDRHRCVAIWAIVPILMLIASAACAQVTARVDRNRLVVGETLTLVLQSSNPQQSLDADLEALQGDFVLLDQRSESQMSIVNGRQSATVRLLVTLEPLRPGTLTIPALDVGGARTQPISIRVDPAPEPAPGEPEPVFIEVELNPASGPRYVHAQLGLTLRLFYQQTLTEAAIGQPEVENASVRLLDEVPFQAERNGQRYRVLERRYAIFPERSGTLQIPPLVLSGRLAEQDANRLWQPSGRGRRISVSSDPITVEILPRPDSFTGAHWQPARNFRITERYSATDGIKVGEPVTRTIIVDAVGLEENMLAEPVWPDLTDARIYPDQPQGISRDDGEWVLGHKEYRYAVVPEKEGELVLPELNIEWWDTIADEQRIATLPARRIQVLPSDLGSTTGSTDSAIAREGVTELSPLSAPAGTTEPAYWKWLTLVFAGLWLATLLFSWRRPHAKREAGPGAPAAEESKVMEAFRSACVRNDAAAARNALMHWLRRFGPGPHGDTTGLLRFAECCNDPELAKRVRELNAAGFDLGGQDSWKGSKLYAAWKAWKKNEGRMKPRETPPITDLYAPENRRRIG